MTRIRWPVALATLFVGLLGWYLVYTQDIVRSRQSDAQTLAEIYNLVQTGLLADPTTFEGQQRQTRALFQLQEAVLSTGVPIVLTGPKVGPPGGDSVIAVDNLPFEDVDLESPEGQARVLQYVELLDSRNPPVGDPDLQHLHYGDPPELARLRWIPWLWVAALLLTVAVGFTLVRSQRRAESERAWTAMARELAHQLGTPISSLQGWLEVLRLSPSERPGELAEGEIADSVEEDLVRLERISHRFELIGRDPELEEVDVHDVVRDLEQYLRPRLPKLGKGVELVLDIAEGVPTIRGNEVLLAWALENVVKNALDALAGRGGSIAILVESTDPGWVSVRVTDSGPGVPPEIRDRIFDPGVTTKTGGWGVGLALSRRILEGVHGGRIALLDTSASGATFQIHLPAT